MGGWIRRGWVLRFWGALIFSPEAPTPFKTSILGPLDWKLGGPKNAKINHDGSNPPFSALWFEKFTTHFSATAPVVCKNPPPHAPRKFIHHWRWEAGQSVRGRIFRWCIKSCLRACSCDTRATPSKQGCSYTLERECHVVFGILVIILQCYVEKAFSLVSLATLPLLVCRRNQTSQTSGRN